MIIFHFHSKIDYCQLLLINIILMFKSTGLSLKKNNPSLVVARQNNILLLWRAIGNCMP